MKRLISGGIAVGVLLALTVAWGAGAEPFMRVTPGELKALIDRKEPNLVVVDSRGNEEYQEAHIRTAVNIPLSVQEQNPGVLRFAKGAPIVFYCNGFS